MSKIDLIYDMVQKIDEKMDQNNTELRERLIKEETHTEEMKEKFVNTEDRVSKIEGKLTLSYLLKLIVGSIITLGSVSAAIAKITDVF